MYWFRRVKLKRVNIGKNVVLVARESLSHINCPYAMIRNVIDWNAFSGLQTLQGWALWANRKGWNTFGFALCGHATFLNLRCGWRRIWLWPNLVDASPQKALLFPWSRAKLPLCVFLSLWFSGESRCCSALKKAECSSVCSWCPTSCALLPWSNEVQCKMWT